jgi:hypothetical protein
MLGDRYAVGQRTEEATQAIQTYGARAHMRRAAARVVAYLQSLPGYMATAICATGELVSPEKVWEELAERTHIIINQLFGSKRDAHRYLGPLPLPGGFHFVTR